MKTPTSKSELRKQLEEEMHRYLHSGGEIKSVAQGVSGREGNAPPAPRTRELFIEPRSERTQIPEVIAALDARRKTPKKPRPKARRQPRKKVIYDDFGEPLRRVWVED